MQKILPVFYIAIIASVLFLFSDQVYAQNTGVKRADLIFTASRLNSAPLPGDTAFRAFALLDGKAIIQLLDTTGITSIRVAITDTLSGAYTIFDKTFTYDVTGPFTDGTSFRRTGNKVYLELGTFRGMLKYNLEITIQPSTGPALSSYSYKKK